MKFATEVVQSSSPVDGCEDLSVICREEWRDLGRTLTACSSGDKLLPRLNVVERFIEAQCEIPSVSLGVRSRESKCSAENYGSVTRRSRFSSFFDSSEFCIDGLLLYEGPFCLSSIHLIFVYRDRNFLRCRK